MKLPFSHIRATPFVGSPIVRRPIELTYNLIRFLLAKLKLNEVGLNGAGLDLDDRLTGLCPLTRRELLELYEDLAAQTDWRALHLSPADACALYQIREVDIYNLQKFRYFLESQLAALARQCPDENALSDQIMTLYGQLSELRLSLNQWP